VPTEEFISNLPDRYRFSLQSEYKTIQKIKMGELNPHDACEKIKDESLLDVCRIVSGALTIESIYPNPASDNNTTITINLSESRKIRADIHDLKGNYIGNIMNERYLSEGTHKIDIDFENKLVQGIYLVAVRSDKGEIATIKLIIN